VLGLVQEASDGEVFALFDFMRCAWLKDENANWAFTEGWGQV